MHVIPLSLYRGHFQQCGTPQQTHTGILSLKLHIRDIFGKPLRQNVCTYQLALFTIPFMWIKGYGNIADKPTCGLFKSNITPSCTNIIVGAYCGEPALYCVSFHYHTTKRSTTLNMFIPYSFSLASSWPARLSCGRDQKGQHSGKQQPHYCKQCS